MITRFYVDNYKCLTNFEYKPKPFELVLGTNGTGKTTVFEALDKVRRFVVDGEGVRDLFSFTDFTRWSSSYAQIFEVDYLANGSECRYRLEISILPYRRVEKESFTRDGVLKSESTWEEPASDVGQVTQLPDDEALEPRDVRTQRVLIQYGKGGITKRPITDPYTFGLGYAFPLKTVLKNLYFIRVNPTDMKSWIVEAQSRPTNNLSNLASYYLHLLHKKQSRTFTLLPRLREVIAGFDEFAIMEDYRTQQPYLQIRQRREPEENDLTEWFGLRLEELSDGQRALIALYTLLYCTLDTNTTLIIDEPENYVALSELQPWLAEMRERVEERGGQVILISHHPEFINALAPENATLFKRDEGGPVRIAEFRTEGFEGLTPAEIVARGWES